MADEGATGDAGIAVGGGLGLGKNTAGINDEPSEPGNDINDLEPRP